MAYRWCVLRFWRFAVCGFAFLPSASTHSHQSCLGVRAVLASAWELEGAAAHATRLDYTNVSVTLYNWDKRRRYRSPSKVVCFFLLAPVTLGRIYNSGKIERFCPYESMARLPL